MWETNDELFKREKGKILEELAGVGYPVRRLADLRDGKRYRPALEVLLRWFEHAKDDTTKWEVSEYLQVRWAKEEVVPALIREFKLVNPKSRDCGGLKWRYADALESVAYEDCFENLVDLLENYQVGPHDNGAARKMLCLAIGKTKHPDAADFLLRYVDDPMVFGHALSGLVKLKAKVPQDIIDRYLQHKEPWIRKEAQKLAEIARPESA